MPIGVRIIDQLNRLADVVLSSPQNNQVLTYNSSSNKWENKDSSSAIGTVTSFVFTDGNGFTGTVTTATSIPTLSLILQAASSSQSGQLSSTDWNAFNAKQAALNGTGLVRMSGTTVSYDNATYLTGNQTITLSGDISGSGTTAITTAIGSNKVTLAMMATIATASILGRSTAATGDVEVLSAATTKTLLSLNNVENTALSTWAGTANITTLGTVATGTWNATAIGDTYISSASTWNAKENALTFSTGLTRSVNTITVNTSQNISTLSNLTSNGFVKTSGGTGALSVDTSTYSLSSHTHSSSDVLDFSEAVDDRVSSLLQSGSGLSWTYNDVANKLTPLLDDVTASTVTLSGNADGENPFVITVPDTQTGKAFIIKRANGQEIFSIEPRDGAEYYINVAGVPFLTPVSGRWDINTRQIFFTAGMGFGDSGLISCSGGGGSVAIYIDPRQTGSGANQGPIVLGERTTSLPNGTSSLSNKVIEVARPMIIQRSLFDEIPLKVVAAVSQTANLQEWQDSNNVPLSYINSVGKFVGDGSLLTNLNKSNIGLGNVENTALSTWAGTSNITTVGTIATGTWHGSVIGILYGGTGQTSANASLNALLPTQTGNNGKVLSTDGSNTSWVASGGSGTVTSVSVVTANGISGSVATDTTTPAITLTLGNITPTTVNALTLASQLVGFTIAGGTTSKTLTVSNTLTFAGTDSSTLNIGAGGTLGSAAFVATSSFEVPLTFSTGLTRSTNTITVNTTQNIAKLSNLTSNGFVKTSGGDGTLSVDTNTYLTANQTITLSGDISGSGTTAITTAIGSNVVTLAMMAQVATSSILGRSTAGTGNVEVLSASTTKTLLSLNNVENTALSTWTGSSNITTAGILTIGTSLGVNTSSFDGTNPERLKVDNSTSSSVNVISGYGNSNTYMQLNIKNNNAGTSASSDIVATADNGNETTNYVDFGINSSAWTNTSNVGSALDGYVYGNGNDFWVGNAASGKYLRFFVGGLNASTNERASISSAGVFKINNLSGVSNRMVIADSSGNLSTQAIPGGGSGASQAFAIAMAIAL